MLDQPELTSLGAYKRERDSLCGIGALEWQGWRAEAPGGWSTLSHLSVAIAEESDGK